MKPMNFLLRRIEAEAIAAALADAAMAQGDATTVTALAVSVPSLEVTGYVNAWGGRISLPEHDSTTLLTFYLKVPAASFGQLYEVREVVQKKPFQHASASHRLIPRLQGVRSLYRTSSESTG
jgi:hypothetical protein